MGKRLLSSKQSTVQFQNNNPGCMWGILQILHNHHWHNVKKMLPLKKHYWGRHARYRRKNHGIGDSEDQQFGVAEAEPLLVSQQSEKTKNTGERSPRRCKKKLHTENRSKEENSQGWDLSFHVGPQHLDSSKKSVQCKESGIIDVVDYSREKDDKTTEAALNQKLEDANKLNRDISNKFNDHIDVLEVFRVENDLLLKLLRDLDIGGKSFQQGLNNKARLTKSGSFPLATSSQVRNIGSSSLNHKKNEIWAFPKGEKSLAGTQVQKKFAASFAKYTSHVKQMPFVTNHDVHSAIKEKSGVSSSRSSEGLNHKGWNQLVVHHFKVIKHKIKHALTEFTKNGYQTSVEAIHHRASSEYRLLNNEKEASQNLEDGVIEENIESRNSDETKASDYDSNKHEVRLMRRTSSLNESLDRYTQLFEQSFGKDINWNNSMSKSLKLTNEDKIHMSGNAPKSRRNLSLPNLESLGFILQEAFRDTNDTWIPVRTSTENNANAEIDILGQRKAVNLPVNEDKPLDCITETEIREIVDSCGRDANPSTLSGITVDKYDKEVTSDHREDIHEPTMEDGSFPQENVEICMTMYLSKDVSAVLEANCQDNATSQAEGIATNTRGSNMDELDTDSPNTGNIYSFCNTNASATAEGANKSRDNRFLHSALDIENDFNFKYVKDVIEYSGFMEDDHIQTWDPVDQLLKPSLFKDLEASLHKETECSGEEISNPYGHQLLFNIVNEVLLELHEKSSTYFPRPFSFNHRLHPMPKGRHLLKEVWTRVDLYLSLQPELDQTLDDVVSRDLAHSGWMNLQWEEECVALELDEMIMEDLLNEIIFS